MSQFYRWGTEVKKKKGYLLAWYHRDNEWVASVVIWITLAITTEAHYLWGS